MILSLLETAHNEHGTAQQPASHLSHQSESVVDKWMRNHGTILTKDDLHVWFEAGWLPEDSITQLVTMVYISLSVTKSMSGTETKFQ